MTSNFQKAYMEHKASDEDDKAAAFSLTATVAAADAASGSLPGSTTEAAAAVAVVSFNTPKHTIVLLNISISAAFP
jgi:hypothetical protein